MASVGTLLLLAPGGSTFEHPVANALAQILRKRLVDGPRSARTSHARLAQ